MDTRQAPVAPSPFTILFARGVIARLAIWATLRIAVQESWGGPGASEKRTWLASVIVDAFEEQNTLPDEQYVEEILLQVMADEFETVLEDGSAESVARDIVLLWDQTKTGRVDSVEKFEGLADKVAGKKAIVKEVVESDDEDWDDEEEESEGAPYAEAVATLIDRIQPNPKDEPEVDDEGFTLVKAKGKGRR